MRMCREITLASSRKPKPKEKECKQEGKEDGFDKRESRGEPRRAEERRAGQTQ